MSSLDITLVFCCCFTSACFNVHLITTVAWHLAHPFIPSSSKSSQRSCLAAWHTSRWIFTNWYYEEFKWKMCYWDFNVLIGYCYCTEQGESTTIIQETGKNKQTNKQKQRRKKKRDKVVRKQNTSGSLSLNILCTSLLLPARSGTKPSVKAIIEPINSTKRRQYFACIFLLFFLPKKRDGILCLSRNLFYSIFAYVLTNERQLCLIINSK